MIHKCILALSLLPVFVACRSTPAIVQVDAAERDPLLSALTGLGGRWEGAPDENGAIPVHEFHVSSNGSAVRELMFPGTEHEMTNMYTLDGSSLVMTHYCAGGNQPHMRATGVDGNRVVFHPDGVSDLKPSDVYYMGAMTLVLVDDDHIEQHWQSFSAGEEGDEMVFQLRRVR